MMEFYRVFDATFGVRCAASGQSASTHSDPIDCNGTSITAPLRRQAGKRKADDADRQGDSEEEDESLPKKSRSGNDDLGCQRKLACPYFKHNPRKYKNVHSCLGPGWVPIARLK